jgi:hypothetical protein
MHDEDFIFENLGCYIGIPDGCTNSTAIGVDLVEAEGVVVGAGAARGRTMP